MATGTLPQGPKAFTGWDSSMYLVWIRAMSDMLLSNSDPGTMDKHTLSNYGGLMHSLTEAAEEMQARELAEMHKAA